MKLLENINEDKLFTETGGKRMIGMNREGLKYLEGLFAQHG